MSDTGINSHNNALPNNREDNPNTTTINDLPIELLAEIFIDCLSSLPQALPPNKEDAPLLLCNVCSSWRYTAISTPGLWSTIMINHPRLKFKGEIWKGLAWISTWLERSGTSPLSICLALNDAPRQTRKLMKLLVPHIDRWSFLYFHCSNTMSLHKSYPAIPSGGARLLECIDISIGPLSIPGNRKFWDWFCTIIDLSPRLHTITSCHIPSRLKWRQMRNITFFGCKELTLSRSRDILEQASLLESAILFAYESQFLPLRHDLRRLRLGGHSPPGPLLGCLTLPSLRELTIYHDEMISELLDPLPVAPLSEQIQSLLTRSSCSIVKFSLSSTTMTESELIECLNHPSINDSLVTLSVSALAHFHGDAFFDYLTVRESAPQILPKLEKLKTRTLMHAGDGVISQMAMSRCIGQMHTGPDGPTQAYACQLKQLTVGFTETPEIDRPKDFAQLNALAASGLSVSFELLY